MRNSRFFSVNKSDLQIYAKKSFGNFSNNERNHRNTDADGGHFQKSGFEWLILCYRCVIGKASDDQNDNDQHADKRQHILAAAKDQVWGNQQDYGNQIGDAGICTGFKCIGPAFAFGR